MDRAHFVFPFTVWWIFGLLPVWAIMNKATLNITCIRRRAFQVLLGKFLGIEYVGCTLTL